MYIESDFLRKSLSDAKIQHKGRAQWVSFLRSSEERLATTIQSLSWSPDVLSCANPHDWRQLECTAFWLSPWRKKQRTLSSLVCNLFLCQPSSQINTGQEGLAGTMTARSRPGGASLCWVGRSWEESLGVAQQHPWAWEWKGRHL